MCEKRNDAKGKIDTLIAAVDRLSNLLERLGDQVGKRRENVTR